MAEIVCVRVIWDREAFALRLPGFHDLHVGPEPGWPFGRKGLALRGAWRQLSTRATTGMLILDGDVAVDPGDVAAMKAAIHGAPGVVHTAAVRLWPASTHRESWVWAHWADSPGQDRDTPKVWRFSFCFTYLPRPLLSEPGMTCWTFPWVDRQMSLAARRRGIGVHVVSAGCSPKHLHF